MMKKSFWYNSDQNGDLLKPRTGHGQYVVDIDNMLFAISGLTNCTVSTYRFFFPVHNVYFVQFDAPVSFMTLYPIGWQKLRGSTVGPRRKVWTLHCQVLPPDTIRRRGDTGAYLGKQGRIQGHILGKSRI